MTALIALAGVGFLRTPSGNRWILGQLLPLVQPDHGRIEVGELETDLFAGLHLRNVELLDDAGHVLIHVDHFGAGFKLGGLPGRRLDLTAVQVDGLRLDWLEGDTCLDPGALWDPGPDTPWRGLGIDVTVEHLEVHAPHVELCAGGEVVAADDVGLVGRGGVVGPRVWWEVDEVRGTLTSPRSAPLRLAGAGSWDGPELRLDPTSVALGEDELVVVGTVGFTGDGALALQATGIRFTPANFGLDEVAGSVTGTATLRGTLLDPQVELAAETVGGALRAQAGLHRADRPTWQVQVDTSRLDVHILLPDRPPTEIHGRLVVTGEGLDFENLSARARFDGGVANFDGHGPFEVGAEARLDHKVVEVDRVHLVGPEGAIQLSGRIAPEARSWSTDVGDSRIRLDTLAGFGLPGLNGTARFSGHVEGSWAEPIRTRITGRARVDRLSWQEEVAAEAVRAVVALEVVGSETTGTVDLETGPVTVYGQNGTSARAAVQLGQGNLGIVGAILAEDRELLGFEGSIDLRRNHLEAGAVRLDLGSGFVWQTSAPLALDWSADGVDGLRLEARSGEAYISANGSIHLRGKHGLKWQAEGVPLAGLGAFTRTGYSGLLSGEGEITGSATNPSVRAMISVTGLGVPDVVEGLNLALSVTAADRRLGVDLRADAGPTRRLVGELGLPFSMVGGIPEPNLDLPISAHLVLLPTELATWGEILAGVVLPPGRASAEVRLTGLLANPAVDLVVAGVLPVGSGGSPAVVDVDAHLLDGRWELRSTGRQELARRVEVTGGGRLDLPEFARAKGWDLGPERWAGDGYVDDLAVDIVPLQLPVAALRPFVTIPTALTGSLVGGLHLSGTATNPTLEGGLMLIDGHLGDQSLSPAVVSLTQVEAGYRVDVDVHLGSDGRLHLAGNVPVRLDATNTEDQLDRPGLDLAVEGSSLPLSAIAAFVPGMTDAQGLVSVSGTVTGSLAHPKPEVAASLTGGAFTLWTTNVRYENVQFGIDIDDTALILRELSAVTRSVARPGERLRAVAPDARPNVTGNARVERRGWSPGPTTLHLQFQDAWAFDQPGRTLRFSGNVDVSGAWPDFTAGGRISVDDGKLVVGESFFSSDTSLALEPDIHVTRPGEAPEPVSLTTLPGVHWDLNLMTALNRSVALDVTMPTEDYGGELTRGLSEVRLEVTLTDVNGLQVRKKGEVYSVVGEVEPVRGTAAVLGQPFTIRGGTIAFTGLDATNPILDLTAEYPSRYGAITARILGSAEEPRITLEMESPYTQDDAVAILVMGAPLAEVGANELVGLALRTLASGRVDDLGQLTQLDVFELGAEGFRTGKRFGSNVLITVGFNTETRAVEASIELQLPQKWLLKLETSSTGESAASATRRWRF